MEAGLRLKRLFLVIGTIFGWYTLVLQFYLVTINRIASIAETVIRFFSYFTVLTNLLIALCFTALLLKPGNKFRSFFVNPLTLTALAVYITVVGIIYNIILRFLWNPVGLQLIVDELLHTVIPIWFLLYWLIFVRKEILTWNILPWLIYPGAYCIYTLARGAIFDFYPYPFIDVTSLGYYRAIINIAGMILVFLVVSTPFNNTKILHRLQRRSA